MKKALPYILIAVVVMIASMWLPVEKPPTSIRAEVLFHLGPLDITNSILTAWVVTVLLAIFFFLGTRNMALRPGKLQNFIEFMIEGIYNLTASVSGPEWVRKFFVVPATIFIFVLATNWFGLFIGLPLIGLGVCEAHHAEEVAHETIEEAPPVETGAKGAGNCAPGEVIVPFFRAPAADLNFTLALALITQIVAQYFGFAALGGGYLSKFIVLDGFRSGGGIAGIALGAINFLVGLIELMSEFIKVIAFTFRLFGNIFAGEVMLLVIVFLVPLIAVTPLIGFEIFVNFIQAFVFYILSVAFYTVAIQPHGGEHH
ncbi:MAG: F0F1 ATP synthase subunit A [Anaerolineae bacterium]|nr:F0F1 ATP synthase subunit A [Anaerolineae bacterium]